MNTRNTPREKISAFVVTFNEAANIKRCLNSLSFCDEIIVIDSLSKDNTVEQALQLGARVIERPWPGYREQKAFGLESCNNEWVINVDADEEISPELRDSITQVLESAAQAPDSVRDGYEISRVVYYFDRWWKNGGWYPEYRLRFFRKGKVTWSGTEPHEKPVMDGMPGRLNGELYHYTYKNLDDQATRLIKFASISAGELAKAKKRASWSSLLLNPASRFVKFYFLKKGYREGMPGLIVAILEGFYSFFKYARLWEEEYLAEKKRSVNGSKDK